MESSSAGALTVTVLGSIAIAVLLVLLGRLLGVWSWAWAWVKASGEEKTKLCQTERNPSTRGYLFNDDLDWIGLWPRTGSYKRFTNLDDLGGTGDDISEGQDIPIPPQPLRPAPGPPPRSIGRSDSAGGGSLGSIGGGSIGGGSTGGGGGGTPSTSSSVVGIGKVDTPPEPARPAPVLERRDSGRSIGRGVHRRDSSKELLRSSTGDLQHSPPRSTNPFKNTSAITANNDPNNSSSSNAWNVSSSSGSVRYMVATEGTEGGGGGSGGGFVGGSGSLYGFVGSVDGGGGGSGGSGGGGGGDIYGVATSGTGSPVRNSGRGSPGTLMRSAMAEKYSSAKIYAMEDGAVPSTAHAKDKSVYPRDQTQGKEDSPLAPSDVSSFRNYSPPLNSVDRVRETALDSVMTARMGAPALSHGDSDISSSGDERRDYVNRPSPYTSTPSFAVSSSPKSADVLPCHDANAKSFSSFPTPPSNRISTPYQEATLSYTDAPYSFSNLANATMHGMRDNQENIRSEAIDASRYSRDIERYPQLLVDQFSGGPSPLLGDRRNLEKAQIDQAYKYAYSDKNDKYKSLRTNLGYDSFRGNPQATMTYKSSNTYDSIRDSSYLARFSGATTAYDSGRLSASEEPTPVFDLSRLGYDDRDPNYDDGIANYGRTESPYERSARAYDDNSTSYDDDRRTTYDTTLYGNPPPGMTSSTCLLYDISAERSPPPPAPMDHRQRRSEESSTSSSAIISSNKNSLNSLPVAVQRTQNSQFDSFDHPATPPNTASDTSDHFEVEYLSQNPNLNRILSGIETDDRGISAAEGVAKADVQKSEIKKETEDAGSKNYDEEVPSTTISGYITNLGRFSYLLKSEDLTKSSSRDNEAQANRVNYEWVSEKQGETKSVSSPNTRSSSFGPTRSLDSEKEKTKFGSDDTNPFRQTKSVDTDVDTSGSPLRSESLEVRCGSNSSCNSLSGATDLSTSAYSNEGSSLYRSTYQGMKESDSDGVVRDIDSSFNTNKVQAYIASLNQRLQELPEEDVSSLMKTQDSFGYASSPPNSASFPGTPPNSSAHSRSHSHFDSYSETPPSSAGFTQTPPNSAFSNPSSFSDTPPNSADPSSGHSFDSSTLTGSSGILKRAMSCDSVNSDTSVTLNELEDTTGQITGYLSIELLYDRDTADLEVKVQEAKDLVGPDPHVSVDSYVRVFLLPDKSTNMQTRLFRRSSNPDYREKFLFALEEDEVSDRALVFYVYASDKFANTLIGEALLKLNECDLSSKVSTTLVLNDSGQKGLGYGEIMFSLSYLPTAERLTVVVVKARSLSWTGEKTSADPFVKVYVLQNGKKVMKKKTSVKKDTTSPVFNEAMIFNIPAPALHMVQLRLTVAEHTTEGKAPSVGHVIVGTQATGKALSHWNQMMSALRKPIGMWHPLRR